MQQQSIQSVLTTQQMAPAIIHQMSQVNTDHINSDRPFLCPVPNCKHDYTSVNGMTGHMATQHLNPSSAKTLNEMPLEWWRKYKKDYCMKHEKICAINNTKHTSSNKSSQFSLIHGIPPTSLTNITCTQSQQFMIEKMTLPRI